VANPLPETAFPGSRLPVLPILGLAAAYFVAGRLGLLLAIPPGYATAIWPAAGIALVGVLLAGNRVVPGVWLGSFLVNLSLGGGMPVAACIGVGAALQAVVAATLVRRFVGFPTLLDTGRAVLGFLGLGGPVGCLIGATVGLMTLVAAGQIPGTNVLFSWWTWWVGDAIGVITIAPIAVILVDTRVGWARRATVAIPQVLGFAGVVAFFVYASGREVERGRRDFEERAEDLAHGLQRDFEGHREVVHSVERLFAASQVVERQEFRVFVEEALERHEGMQALSWAASVAHADRAARESAERVAGLSTFEITERSSDGSLVRAADRDAYAPVVAIEPLRGNEAAVGFDLRSCPDRRAALEAAVRTGRATATGPLTLVQEPGGQRGLLIVVPGFDPGLPVRTVEERRAALRGYATGVFRVDDMIAAALRGREFAGIEVRLLDATDPAGERLLGTFPSGGARASREAADWRTDLDIAGRRWVLSFAPTSPGPEARGWQVWAVLAAGLFNLGLLGAVLLTVTGHVDTVEALVAEGRARNAELGREVGERRLAEAALRRSEARFRRLFEANVVGFMVGDRDGRIQEANDAFLRTVGYTRDDLAAGRIRRDEITPPDHRGGSIAAGDPARSGVTGPWEQDYIRKDGARVPVIVGEAELPDADESIAFALDITDRKRMETALLERERLACLAAEVSIALTQGDTLKDVLKRCAEAAVQRLGAAFARIWTLDADGKVLDLQASAGLYTHTDGPDSRVPLGQHKIGRIALERRPHITNDLRADPIVGDPDWAQREGMVAFAGYPLLVDGELVGVMAVFARKPLSEALFRGLGAIADTLAIGIRRKLVEAAKTALEGKLRQAQKMEAVGQLAGGVAHDFNNLLTAVIGYCDMLLPSVDEPQKHDVREIKKAADRAASLTHQLLAYSRKQILQPTVIDLNAVVTDMRSLLRRLIGEDIDLAARLSPRLGRVRADRGQVEQIIMNLAVNARDAMAGRGGKLDLETAEVTLDERYGRENLEVTPGPYVMLAVSDTGTGMTPEVRAHLFEPFFTTKEQGKGTGLGLATVYGIVKQSGGHITVESEVGLGTTFRIYLPRLAASDGPAEKASPRQSALRGSEAVLLVEDEEILRTLGTRMLENYGYSVLAAEGGDRALEICRRHAGPIAVLLTDVIMPGMSGPTLASRALELRPEMKVIFMSGYTDDEIGRHGLLEPGVELIQKPFAGEALARRLKALLRPDTAPAVAGAPG